MDQLIPQVADVPKAVGRRSVEILIVKGKSSRRRDDPANRCGRSKSLLDALVKLGMLVDDDDVWLDYAPVKEIREKLDYGYTRIKLEETDRAFDIGSA